MSSSSARRFDTEFTNFNLEQNFFRDSFVNFASNSYIAKLYLVTESLSKLILLLFISLFLNLINVYYLNYSYHSSFLNSSKNKKRSCYYFFFLEGQANLLFAHTYENFGEEIKDPEFCQEFMPNYETIIKVCEKSQPAKCDDGKH